MRKSRASIRITPVASEVATTSVPRILSAPSVCMLLHLRKFFQYPLAPP